MERMNLEWLAAFFTELKQEDVPAAVQEKAKLCLLDVLECCAQAPEEDHRLKGALASVRREAGYGNAAVWGADWCVPAAEAAFVNAVRGSISYRNDLHRKSAVHAGAIVCAAALAAAEQSGAAPSQTLLGIIAGYESMIRLGEVLAVKGLHRGFRSSAVCAPFGAAVACGKVWGLSERELISAASFSCHSGAGNNEWACAGTGEDVFHAGWGARNGLQAAQLALAGAVGCASGLEGENGMLACFDAFDGLPLLTQELGRRYRILEVEHKPIAACLMLQAPCQAAERIAQQDGFSPDAITKIEIIVSAQAKRQPGCDAPTAENLVQAKMNLRYGVVQSLLGVTPCWQPPDVQMKTLMKRCVVREDHAFTALFPQKTAALVRVTAGNHVFEDEEADFTPLQPEQVEARYHSSCKSWLGSEREAQLFHAVKHMEQLSDITQLTGLLKR